MSKKKKEKLCKNCGKVLENRQSIYCSLKCMSDYTYKGANKGRGRSERSKYCKNDNPEQEEIDK